MEEKKEAPKIDLTKIKNLNAVEGVDSEFASNLKRTVNESSRKASKAKYCFQPAVRVALPSKGRFYQDADDEDLRNGYVSIIPMSIADEEILTNRAYLKNNTCFKILFETCMENNYPAERLLSYDAMYMMYVLRSITYGSDYTFKTSCSSCGNEITSTISIDDINFDEISDDEPDKRDIKLPISKFTITMHLMRLEDEERINLIENKYKDVDAVSPIIASILGRTDCIKDANGDEIPKDEYIDFLSNLPPRDRIQISRSFANTSKTPLVSVSCGKCGNTEQMELPLGSGFFLLTE